MNRNKQAEQYLKKANKELDERVMSKTRELSDTIEKLLSEIAAHKQTEENLVLARNQAVEANEAKSEFLSNMSHELRTPMHGILGFASFGITKIDSTKTPNLPNLRDYYLEISSCGNRLLALINDLLDLAKLEARKMKYVFEPGNLSKLVNIIIKESSPLQFEKKLVVNFNHPDFDDTAVLDSDRIMQVIRNLLSNAIKFSKSGGVIDVEMTDQDDTLCLSVSDNGTGIPENELGLVFEKFSQSSRTTANKGGTGLGLPISKRIISDHRGKIWADNNPRGGAIFFITIPKHRDIAKKIGEILIDNNFITRDILDQSLEKQHLSNK